MDKKIVIDIDKCVGCGTCVVACMDQNDIFPENGGVPFRRIYQTECGKYPETRIRYIPLGCMHCVNATCIAACPSGAMYKNGISVQADREKCTGCRSCLNACLYGVPNFDSQNRISKCNLCEVRVENGLTPVCVKACPFGALRFAEHEESENKAELLEIVRRVHGGAANG